jgi:hypothetical protein
MPAAWAILDTFYDDPMQFARDLMQDIQAVHKIKENEFDRLLEYYILLQGHIAEADKADQGDMLLIPANIEEMMQALPLREEMLWREEQANVHPRDYGYSFSLFVDARIRWTIAQVAGSKKTLPKPTPRGSNRSLSNDRRWDRPGRGSPGSRGAHVMVAQAVKKVHFPPSKAWDPETLWRYNCVMDKNANKSTRRLNARHS